MNDYSKAYLHMTEAYWRWSDKKQNLVFSPLSMTGLLTMLAAGAAGKTQKEILRAVNGERDHKTVCDLLTKGGSLHNANALITKEILENSILPEFREKMTELFDGEIFATRNYVEAVNDWVRQKTFGQILEIADESMKNAALCLINAESFLATWEVPYTDNDIYEYGEFTNADGSTSMVDMLFSSEALVEDRDYVGFVKQYFGREYSFMALLPKNGALPCPDFAGLLAQEKKERVGSVEFPEFSLSAGADLIPFCRELGIRQSFTAKADFSSLSCEKLRVDRIISKSCIEVNRQGTKASAVNLADIRVTGAFMPKILMFDRPFVFAVMHNGTGLPVFTGMVNQLENKELPEEDE